VLTSYTTTLILIPRLLYPQRYLVFVLIYVGVLVLTSGGLGKAMSIIASYGVGKSIFYGEYMKEELTFFYAIMLILFSNVLVSSAKIANDRFATESAAKVLEKQKLELEKQKLELERERLATELKFLKSQINPHFLFNSLNSIFNLIEIDPNQARELLAKFSAMLRYHLYETETDKITLETELTYIYSYAEMEKVRKGKNIDISIEVQPGIGYLEVVPLVLLTFVENAFKHVSAHKGRPNRVAIQLAQSARSLFFKVENTKEPGGRPSAKNAGGIGIANAKRRLELIYPGGYDLLIDDQPDHYTVTLTIHLCK
jgi:two-component system, LytTR family, sensor kinase